MTTSEPMCCSDPRVRGGRCDHCDAWIKGDHCDAWIKDSLIIDVDYTCECELTPVRRLYTVTSHEGRRTVCAYCDDCASAASIDWNGETASIEPMGGAS